MNLFKKIIFVWILLKLVTSYAQAEPDVVVVVSQKSNITTISASELKLIYYKKIRQVGDKVSVEPRDQAEGEVKQAFYQSFFGRGTEEIKNFWMIQVFRGREGPPGFVGSENDRAMIDWLLKYPNAIGYINKNQVSSTVRVLDIK